MNKFGIIAVDYENHVPRQRAYDGLISIQNQTYDNYEIFLCHDGRKKVIYENEFDLRFLKQKMHFLETSKRMNDWGHSSRDLAMRYAFENSDCDYYIQFNIDNLFEPFAFDYINKKIDETMSKVVIFTIRHHKLSGKGIKGAARFSGLPPHQYNIDAMQLVAHKDIWKNYNFWYNKHEQSDGLIYQKICKENRWVHITDILGDNR